MGDDSKQPARADWLPENNPTSYLELALGYGQGRPDEVRADEEGPTGPDGGRPAGE